jgi:hypothetical protein
MSHVAAIAAEPKRNTKSLLISNTDRVSSENAQGIPIAMATKKSV